MNDNPLKMTYKQAQDSLAGTGIIIASVVPGRYNIFNRQGEYVATKNRLVDAYELAHRLVKESADISPGSTGV